MPTEVKATPPKPFYIAVPDSDVTDLRRRIRETRWPSAVRGAGWSMGLDLGYLRALADFWSEGFDWRAAEDRLNAYRHFVVETSVGPVHFVRILSRAQRLTPLVLTHGWPSTFAELLRVGELLAGSADRPADSGFDVVIPSLPGYGFSPPPQEPGTGVWAIADAWVELMQTLGYARFVAHGGDLGAGVSTAIALRHPRVLAGLHLNYIPGSYDPYVPDSQQLSREESEFLARRREWADAEGGYAHLQGTKPDTLGPALNDSPVGLAAWMVDKFRAWSDCDGDIERRFTKTELLTTISIYWFTRSMPSAIRLYWEGRRAPMRLSKDQKITAATAVAHFRRELPIPPRQYVERGYNLTRWTEYSRGGHFAAAEEPELLAGDIRSFVTELELDPYPAPGQH
jgi:pimeloyl-ACP methyl ester carboxylesterase